MTPSCDIAIPLIGLTSSSGFLCKPILSMQYIHWSINSNRVQLLFVDNLAEYLK